MSRNKSGTRRAVQKAPWRRSGPAARPEPLESRLLLSVSPAANITTMIDHSGGFGATFDMRLNSATAGLPAVTNVTDPNTGNVVYSNVLQLTNGKGGETSSAFSDPAPDGTADVLG